MDDQTYSILTQEEFNHHIELLGPWGNNDPNGAPVAVAVSGGADSLCLVLLASRWKKNIIALIVDHQLRSSSTEEAILTQKRLTALQIPSKILTLNNLQPGPGLEERARIARYAALIDTCYHMGCVDLLLGHHAGDQAETVLMRIRAGSHEDGLSAMARIMELPKIRLVRPLLSIYPQRLRETLRHENIGWVEDSSNQDMQIQRNQIRKELSVEWQRSGSVSLLLQRSLQEGFKRMQRDQWQADYVVKHCHIRPEGFALISSSEIDARALGALIRTISGSVYTPLHKSVERLARNMHATTLGGVKITPAGKMGDGWLLIREEAAIEGFKPAVSDCIWDQRFRLVVPQNTFKENILIGALGDAYKQFSDRQGLPVSILRTLPALWSEAGVLLSVPHLKVYLQDFIRNWKIIFQPKQSLTQSYLFSVVERE